MTAANLPNPFAQHKVDNTLEVPPGDVPHLHREVLERCLSAINMACDDRQSHAILVIGEAGSGKSHLLASLRARLQNRRDVVLAGIRLGGTYSGRLWRQVRERLFDELLRPLPPSSDHEHALGRILENRLADRRISSSPETPDSLPMLARPQTGRNRVNADRLQTLGRCVSIDRRLFRVLEQMLEEGLTPVIRSWLRGETLEEDDWEELGFSPQDQDESDEEIAAEQVIRSILRIAGAGRSAMGHDTVLAICFDEVEGLFAQSDDRSVLKRFAHLATELLAEPGPRVVVSFVRPKLVEQLQETIEGSHFQKIGQEIVTIPPLRLDEAIDVVRARLQTQRPSTSVNFGNDPLAPIGRRFVEQLHRRHPRSLTPRQLIMACQEEYNRRCSESALAPRLDTSALATSGSNDHDHFAYLNETWESRCQTLSRHVTTLAFDSILGITLPWLVQVEKLPLTLCDELPRPYGDINLIFRQSRRPDLWGISFCNHEPMYLWRRLDRLAKQWQNFRDGFLSQMILLRCRTTRTTDKGRERLDRLQSLGVRIFYIEPQQLTELAAYQDMVSAAYQGDLVAADGSPIEEANLRRWAEDHLAASVKEMLVEIFGSLTGESPPAGQITTLRRSFF